MLRQRIFTAVVALVLLGLVLFVLPAIAARMVIAALILVGAWEWGGLLNRDSSLHRSVYVAFIGILIAVLVVQVQRATPLHLIYEIALAWWLAALAWMFFYPTPIAKIVTWVAGVLVLVPAWAGLDSLYQQSPQLLLLLLLIVWVADIGAYFVGKGFGRVKLAPSISPGKSWEGVLGGLLSVTLLAAIAGSILGIGIGTIIPFCLAVGMVSIVGDLTVSMFKRNAGVKDSGSIFPGHGGVLDRIDSVTAAAPLYVLALGWIGLR